MDTDNLSASICSFKEPKTRFLQQIHSHFFALLSLKIGSELATLAMQSSVHTTHFVAAIVDDCQFQQSVPYPAQQFGQPYEL